MRVRIRLLLRRPSGFTLIELMVAMVLGLLVAAGILTVFMSTSNSNKAQNQLAGLQEQGRFAITQIRNDLSMADSQYGANTGGNASQSTAGPYLDGLRSPDVYAYSSSSSLVTNALSDLTTQWGATSGGTVAYPSEPTDGPYPLPAFFWMRGYDCGSVSAGCKPIDPHSAISAIPKMGTAVGDRVVGSDVITVRYINPTRGWSIGKSGGSSITLNTDGSTIKQINLAPLSGEPPVSDFGANDLAMLANYSGAEIFSVTGQGGSTLTPTGANYTASIPAMAGTNAVELFDFNRDFQTVTYYLKVVSVNNDGNAPFTGALIRRVNGDVSSRGGSEQELVRGVERLNFKYGVMNADGKIEYLTADEVDTRVDSSGNSIPCPPDELKSSSSTNVVGPTIKGCLWRAITGIEVDLLMDGQTPLYTLTPNEMEYTYATDGSTTPEAPSSHTIKPSDQGFPDQLIRREFTTLVSLRNYNP